MSTRIKESNTSAPASPTPASCNRNTSRRKSASVENSIANLIDDCSLWTITARGSLYWIPTILGWCMWPHLLRSILFPTSTFESCCSVTNIDVECRWSLINNEVLSNPLLGAAVSKLTFNTNIKNISTGWRNL